MFSIKEHLHQTSIFDKTSELDIFQYYFPFEVGKKYKSPFRREENPSFAIYNDGRMWSYTDFGSGEGGNCIKFVARLLNLSYFEAVKRIDKDLNLGIYSHFKDKPYKDIIYTKKEAKIDSNEVIEKVIKFTAKEFTLNDLKYWNLFGISQDDLKREEIYSIKRLWISDKSGKLQEFKFKKDDLVYGYRFLRDGEENKKKIYQPFNKQKWLGNISTKHVEGLNQLPFKNNSIIISKSRKDSIVLRKIYEDTCNTQNELSGSLPYKFDSFFDKYYKSKFILWDNDFCGKENCKKLNNRGYCWINIPNKYKEKDPAEIIQHFGVTEGYKILQEEINKKIK